MNLSELNADRRRAWRIGTFAPFQLGDTIMATPLYQALRRHFPEARLTLITQATSNPVLEGLDIFDETILYSPDLEFTDRFDLFVHPVYCGDQKISRHFDRFGCTLSLNRLLEKKRKSLRNRIDRGYSHLLFYKHQIEINEELARWIGDKNKMPAPYCAQGDPDVFKKWKDYTGIFVGDVRKGQQFPDTQWKKLAALIGNNQVLFIGAPGNQRNVSGLAEQCGQPYEITQSIKDYTALCKNLKLLVAEDGGAVHMAATTGVDMVVLYGKSSPVLLHPWVGQTGRCIAVSSPNLCSPCDRSWSWRAVEEGLRPITCMQNISPESVARAVHQIASLESGAVRIQKGNILKTKKQYLRDIPRQAGWLSAFYRSWWSLHFVNKKEAVI